MITGGVGGGNTVTGLAFENRVDLDSILGAIDGYQIIDIPNKAGKGVFFHGLLLARTFKKHDFYRFLMEEGVDWNLHLSKRMLPDNALLVVIRDTLFIIEIKFQQVNGSVDEKLQTCDFKKKQYQRLLAPKGLKVEYIYVLNDWFKHKSYADTLAYIHSVGCLYVFNEIPLKWLGLPDGN